MAANNQFANHPALSRAPETGNGRCSVTGILEWGNLGAELPAEQQLDMSSEWIWNCCSDPSQIAEWIRASSWYTKVVGSIPSQGAYKSQPMNA